MEIHPKGFLNPFSTKSIVGEIFPKNTVDPTNIRDGEPPSVVDLDVRPQNYQKKQVNYEMMKIEIICLGEHFGK